MDDDNESTEDMMIRARSEAQRGISKYGSVDKWPTLALLPQQFPVCAECGRLRTVHKMASTDRLGHGQRTTGTICTRFEAVGRFS